MEGFRGDHLFYYCVLLLLFKLSAGYNVLAARSCVTVLCSDVQLY